MAEPYIHMQSALWLTGAFRGLIAERFSEQNKTPWRVYPSISDPGEHDAKPLYALTMFDEDTEAEDLYPRIVSVVGQQVGGQRTVLGTIGPEQGLLMEMGEKHHVDTLEYDMGYEVYGEVKGECYYLAELMRNTLTMAHADICRVFTLRDLKPVVIQRPQKTTHGKWRTDVNFRIFLEERWWTAPPINRVGDVKVRINFANITIQAGEQVRVFE